MYCGLSAASEVFLIFTTQLYQYFSVFFLFAPVSDEPRVFLPKYSQTAIPHAAHFPDLHHAMYLRYTFVLQIIGEDVRFHNRYQQAQRLQHSTAMYSFSYKSWLQLAAEYGGCSQLFFRRLPFKEVCGNQQR